MKMPLNELAKTFGFKPLKIGFFPFLLNSPENWDYEANQLPNIESYVPTQMKNDDFENFTKWYMTNKNTYFNFKKDIIEYTISNVEI